MWQRYGPRWPGQAFAAHESLTDCFRSMWGIDSWASDPDWKFAWIVQPRAEGDGFTNIEEYLNRTDPTSKEWVGR